MTPQEIFNSLMQGKKVKLTNERFESFLSQYTAYKTSNEFIIRSIEETCVNLYNEEIDEVFYDFYFEDILLF